MRIFRSMSDLFDAAPDNLEVVLRGKIRTTVLPLQPIGGTPQARWFAIECVKKMFKRDPVVRQMEPTARNDLIGKLMRTLRLS